MLTRLKCAHSVCARREYSTVAAVKTLECGPPGLPHIHRGQLAGEEQGLRVRAAVAGLGLAICLWSAPSPPGHQKLISFLLFAFAAPCWTLIDQSYSKEEQKWKVYRCLNVEKRSCPPSQPTTINHTSRLSLSESALCCTKHLSPKSISFHNNHTVVSKIWPTLLRTFYY